MVVNAILPGGEKGGKAPPKRGDPGVKDLGSGHSSPEAAIEAINAAFTIF